MARPDPLLNVPWVQALQELLRERLGCEVPPVRMIREVAPFLLARAAEEGFDDPAVLVEALRRSEADAAWRALVHVATIGETYFFRHPAQIAALAARGRRAYARLARPLRIWSAGCSSGEEAWSIAMRLHEERVPCEIVGSDANAEALARASAGGSYSDRSVGHLPEPLRERWFESAGRGRWRLVHPGSLAVRFTRHNLVTEAPLRPASGAWDLILCRNVIIYFAPEIGSAVIESLGRGLDDEGSLWIAPCDHVRLEKSAILVPDREGSERFLRRRGVGETGVATSRRSLPGPPARQPVTRADAAQGDWAARLAMVLAKGLHSTGRALVDERLREHPDDGAAWAALSAFHLRDHAFDQALEALERAATATPRPAGLAYFRGTALLKSGRHADALVAFHAAIQDDPDDWASSWQAASLYRRAGRSLPEQVMLRRTAELLDQEEPHAPAFGPAASLVNSIHRDPQETRRHVAARLDTLEAREAAAGGLETSIARTSA